MIQKKSLSLTIQRLQDLSSIADILNSVPITEYYKLGNQLLIEAEKARKYENFELCYVHYYKLLKLLLNKLPNHNGYALPQYRPEKIWAIQTSKLCLDSLEEITILIERRELNTGILQSEIDLELINEFDKEESCNPQIQIQSKYDYDPSILSNALNLLRLKESKCHDIGELKNSPNIRNNLQHIQEVPESRKHVDIKLPLPDQSFPNFAYKHISKNDLNILRAIKQFDSIGSVSPQSKLIDVTVGEAARFVFSQDDFCVSFSPFLQRIHPALQILSSAIETNRCFFIHLGVAIGVHPFALQTAFRCMAQSKMNDPSMDTSSVSYELLSTVLELAGLVDANVLTCLWPLEFSNTRICFISGPSSKPTISIFQGKAMEQSSSREIIIRHENSHFTLLRPLSGDINHQNKSFSFLSEFVKDASRNKVAVQIYDVDHIWCIADVIQDILLKS